MRIFKISLLALIAFLCTGCSSSKPSEKNTTSGLIEGRPLSFSSSVAGKLISLPVKLGETVKEKQLLFKLDPQPQATQLANIEAELEKEKLALSALQLKPADSKTNHLIAVQKNQIQQKKVALEKAKWALSEKTILASQAGIITHIFYHTGEFVPEGKPVVALLSPSAIKLTFFLPQKALGEVKRHEIIFFDCETCLKKQKATIDFISHEPDKKNRTYRIEARIPEGDALRYHPGQEVKVQY